MGTPALGASPGYLTSAFRSARPLYLPTSVIPGLVGCLVALGVDGANFALLPLVLLGVLLVHAGTDVCNEAEDFANGVDSPDTIENSGVFTAGHLTVEQGRRLYGGLFAVTVVIGLVLCLLSTWWLLVYGGLGVLGGWLYTGGPKPFKYVGLGDPFIVFLMGPLLTHGAYTALTGDAWDPAAFVIGFVPGFLILAVLQSNNAADIPEDEAAGVRTLAVRLGEPWASRLIVVSLLLTFVTPVVLVATGLLGPWLLLVLVLVPLAVPLARSALPRAPATLTPQVAQLHLLTSVLLCAAVVLDRGF